MSILDYNVSFLLETNADLAALSLFTYSSQKLLYIFCKQSFEDSHRVYNSLFKEIPISRILESGLIVKKLPYNLCYFTNSPFAITGCF